MIFTYYKTYTLPIQNKTVIVQAITEQNRGSTIPEAPMRLSTCMKGFCPLDMVRNLPNHGSFNDSLCASNVNSSLNKDIDIAKSISDGKV